MLIRHEGQSFVQNTTEIVHETVHHDEDQHPKKIFQSVSENGRLKKKKSLYR
jgi:hypothetical protein